ncbi:MAG: hypothetical protein PHS48_08140 [Bacteroidales bacterium]|nr:hypothetical protein [Bacteroidales bacterium]
MKKSLMTVLGNILMASFFVCAYSNDTVKSPMLQISPKDTVNRSNEPKRDLSRLLYVINEKIVTYDSANKINPATIEKIEILSGESATGKYGEKAKNGVAEITLKKN